jgi:hypothetical protein
METLDPLTGEFTAGSAPQPGAERPGAPPPEDDGAAGINREPAESGESTAPDGSGNAMRGSSAPSPAGEVAFAAKVQPASQVRPPVINSSRSAPQPAASGAGGVRKEETGAAEPNPPNGLPVSAHATAAFQQNRQLDSASVLPRQPTPTASRAVSEALLPEPRPSLSTAPKDISLQVSQAGEDKVQIRLVQQSGELHVAVRTGDPALAQGLQQGLPDLVSRLENRGFKTETWQPVSSVTPAAAAAEAPGTPNHSESGEPQTPPGWSQQQNGQKNQNQNQGNRPQWVDELQSTLGGSPESQGESHGIVN